MAESESKRMGWFKAIIGAAAGLLSGGAVMYVSPLLDKVVKPGKPLANFAVETDGLTVTFHNRYAGEGWWDFGDGTPLEPALPQQPSISHTYAKAGTYPAKLTVRNFVGDEHERSVSLDITVASSHAAAPSINLIEAAPIGSDRSAPATFRLVAQTQNCERLLWDMGSDRQPEVVSDATAKQEKLMTFATPGDHLIQLTALNGDLAVKKTVTVHVDAPRTGMLVARLNVIDRGTRSNKTTTTERVPFYFEKKDSAGPVSFDKSILAPKNAVILEAKLGELNPAFRNVKVAISQDKKTIHITGDVSPTAEMLRAPNPPSIPVLVTQERHWQMNAPPTEMSSAIAAPGSVKLPLPPMPTEGTQLQRTLVLDLRATGLNWQQPLPVNAPLDWQGHRYTVKAAVSGTEVKVEILP